MAYTPSRPSIRGTLPEHSEPVASPTPAQHAARDLSLPPTSPPSLPLEYPPRSPSPSPSPPPRTAVPLFRPSSDDEASDKGSVPGSDAPEPLPLSPSAFVAFADPYFPGDALDIASEEPAAPARPQSPHFRHDERVRIIEEWWRTEKAKIVGSSISAIRSIGANSGNRSLVLVGANNVYAEKRKRQDELDELESTRARRIVRSEAIRDRELSVALPRVTVRKNRVLDSEDEGFPAD